MNMENNSTQQFPPGMFNKGQKKGPRKPKRIYEALSEEEFIKLLNITKKKHHKVAFILAYGSGLRISEICSLQPGDINLKEHKMFIRQAKGSKDRIVNTPKWLRQSHLAHIPMKVGQRALEAVFLRNSLKCGINRKIGSFIRAGKEVPIYRFHFHCLRHSYATRCIEKNVPMNQLQIMMGHENLATTSRYTKANPHDAISSILDAGV